MATGTSGTVIGIRAVKVGLLVNALLAAVKFTAGVLGNSYALIADAIESSTDIFSSLIVWAGLRVASKEADEKYPFGYGKAESVAAAVVAVILLGAAGVIVFQAVREIVTPHHLPEPFTLYVLVGVVVVKETLFRKVFAVGSEVGSTALRGDAWHHRSDALTSLAAFIGISIALWKGPGWEPADDWAALVAAGVIVFNSYSLFKDALADLMDKAPSPEMLQRVTSLAMSIDEVRALEKLKVRKSGLGYYIEIHVKAAAEMSLHDSHIVSGRVKSAIRNGMPHVLNVHVHMEPYVEDPTAGHLSGLSARQP